MKVKCRFFCSLPTFFPHIFFFLRDGGGGRAVVVVVVVGGGGGGSRFLAWVYGVLFFRELIAGGKAGAGDGTDRCVGQVRSGEEIRGKKEKGEG